MSYRLARRSRLGLATVIAKDGYRSPAACQSIVWDAAALVLLAEGCPGGCIKEAEAEMEADGLTMDESRG